MRVVTGIVVLCAAAGLFGSSGDTHAQAPGSGRIIEYGKDGADEKTSVLAGQSVNASEEQSRSAAEPASKPTEQASQTGAARTGNARVQPVRPPSGSEASSTTSKPVAAVAPSAASLKPAPGAVELIVGGSSTDGAAKLTHFPKRD